MVISCSMCTTKYVKGSGISFHKFPSNRHLRKQWIIATERKDFNPSKSAVLCSKHFKKEDYLERLRLSKLKPSAAPSLFDYPQHLQTRVIIPALHYSSEKSIKKNSYSLIHSCKKCIYVTKSLFFMRNHVKRHQVIRPFFCSKSKPEIFICKECNFKTYETITFKNHIKDHNLSKDIAINLQNRSILIDTFGSNLHENPEKKGWQSNSCTDEFNSKDLLRRNTVIRDEKLCQHYSSHQKNKSEQNINSKTLKRLRWFQCQKCSYNTTNNLSLMRHVITKHRPEENKWFHCDKCEYKTNRTYNLKYHLSMRHTASEDIEWIHCAQCSYRTKGKSSFKLHMYLKHAASERT